MDLEKIKKLSAAEQEKFITNQCQSLTQLMVFMRRQTEKWIKRGRWRQIPRRREEIAKIRTLIGRGIDFDARFAQAHAKVSDLLDWLDGEIRKHRGNEEQTFSE